MLFTGSGGHTCRRRADTPEAQRPRLAPAPSSTRGIRWVQCSAPGSSDPAGCAAGSSPPAAAASAGHMGRGRGAGQGLRDGSGQEGGRTRGLGQIPERRPSWERVRIPGKGWEWPGSGKSRSSCEGWGQEQVKRGSQGQEAGQAQQVGATTRGQAKQGRDGGRERKGAKV